MGTRITFCSLKKKKKTHSGKHLGFFIYSFKFYCLMSFEVLLLYFLNLIHFILHIFQRAIPCIYFLSFSSHLLHNSLHFFLGLILYIFRNLILLHIFVLSSFISHTPVLFFTSSNHILVSEATAGMCRSHVFLVHCLLGGRGVTIRRDSNLSGDVQFVTASV